MGNTYRCVFFENLYLNVSLTCEGMVGLVGKIKAPPNHPIHHCVLAYHIFVENEGEPGEQQQCDFIDNCFHLYVPAL